MSDLTQLSTENARLSDAVSQYHKLTEAQRETIAQLLEALTKLMTWMGEGTRRGRPIDMMTKRDIEYYYMPARAAIEAANHKARGEGQ